MENNNRKGCRWVKASERQFHGQKICRWYVNGDQLRIELCSWHYLKNWTELSSSTKLEDVEWLDESIEPCATSSKESVKRFDKVINCLAVELPMEVWTSVHYEWIKFRNETLSPSHTGDRDCEELKKEVERLKGLIKKQWELSFYLTCPNSVHEGVMDELFKNQWEKFKTENNL